MVRRKVSVHARDPFAPARNVLKTSEQRLEAWCELAGLPARVVTATVEEQHYAVIARLDLASRPVVAKPRAAPAGRTLSHLLSPDDHPYHTVAKSEPSAWMPRLNRRYFDTRRSENAIMEAR